MNVNVGAGGIIFALRLNSLLFVTVLSSVKYAILCPRIPYKLKLTLCTVMYLQEGNKPTEVWSLQWFVPFFATHWLGPVEARSPYVATTVSPVSGRGHLATLSCSGRRACLCQGHSWEQLCLEQLWLFSFPGLDRPLPQPECSSPLDFH